MGLTRRSFITAAVTGSVLAGAEKKLPVGLELFSVRGELKKDDVATVRQVAKMGYEAVEFFSPYYGWPLQHATEMRKVLDDNGLRCFSTHNSLSAFEKDNLAKTIDLNHALGVKYVVCASAGSPKTLDGWRGVGEKLTTAMETLRPARLRAGYHNHQTEFTPIEGKRPMEVIAASTPKDFMLQFDVGTCVEVGSDPVAWINANPGRINSLHCKDWSKTKGYRVMFGEGDVDWQPLFAAALGKGGLEYVLIEQEGSEYSEFEAAKKCLDNYQSEKFRKMRAA